MGQRRPAVVGERAQVGALPGDVPGRVGHGRALGLFFSSCRPMKFGIVKSEV
jgi:hypothetical protein